MGSFLDFLAVHRIGLAVAVIFAGALALFVQWLAWIFGLGRFKTRPPSERTFQLRFVIADFLVKIIDDFRHLLALVLLLIFAGTLAAVLNWGAKDFAQVKEGLQVVMATLGGLVGSIIGYYFGESAVRKSAGPDSNPGQPAVPIPPPAGPPNPPVPAPNPPVPAPNPPV
jgi:hypothetical protein